MGLWRIKEEIRISQLIRLCIENQMNWYKKAQVYGEWWITDTGDVLFADGDAGSDVYNHEMQVLNQITSDYFDKELTDFDFSSLTEDDFIRTGMPQEARDVLEGRTDARDYGMKILGWIRVADKYIQAWYLTGTTLRNIANGLFEAYGTDAFKQKYVIESLSNGKNYSPVPYEAIDSGNPRELLQYKEWDVMNLRAGMNWYIKYIFAQSTELGNYLVTLGIGVDIINYVESLDPQTAQYLTNELRKNPAMTLEQVQSFQLPQKEDPYLPSEKRLAANFEVELPQFSKWILVNLRKLRNSQKPPMGDMRIQDANDLNYAYFELKNKIPELQDWIGAMNPDISSFTPKQAIALSDEWHNMMASKGEGFAYEPTLSENIMYGPKWSNPEWDGWTVQRVVSENDLLTEGNKRNMDHCVGSYCDDVNNRISVIYSLRDPNNKPHLTMEVEGNRWDDNWNNKGGGDIIQSMGKSNSEPKEVYKEMMKEFITNRSKEAGIRQKIGAFDKLEEEEYNPDIENMEEALDAICRGDSDEYGLIYVLDRGVDILADEITAKAESQRNSYYNRSPDLGNISLSLVQVSIKEDLQLPIMPRTTSELKKIHEEHGLQKSNWKNINELETWAWGAIDEAREDLYSYDTGLSYPQEEDYDTPEEYEDAMEEHNNQEAEIYDEWLKESTRGSFAKEILDDIKSYEKMGLIISSEQRYEIAKKKQEQKLIDNPAYQNTYEQEQETANQAVACGHSRYKKAQQRRKKEIDPIELQNLNNNGPFRNP